MADATSEITACQKMFADFARQTSNGTPLYSRLAGGIAGEDRLARMLLHAPAAQRLPVLLFACVHWLVLAEPDAPLARFYPNLAGDDVATGDPFPTFGRFCDDHADALAALLASRQTQTNEIGRTALFVPAFGLLEREVGTLAHVDVGASAGLNLLIPQYDFRFEPGGSIATGSTVQLVCGTRGEVPVPGNHPSIAAAIGIDQSPIDVDDTDQAQWLEACVWPDQVGRFDRLRAAIEIARTVGVDVRAGDAVTGVAQLVDEIAGDGHPVLTTSWVMNYLSADERLAFIAAVDALAGAGTDCSWVYAESPALCPELPGIPPPTDPDQPTALVAVRWRGGERTTEHLANAHPHGAWMHWLNHPGTTS